MHSILEGLKGVVSIADDVCVFGITDKEHDTNLINLMERAKRESLVFNSTKYYIPPFGVLLFITHLSYHYMIRLIYNNIYYTHVPLPHYQANLPYYCRLKWIQPRKHVF